MCPVPCPTLVGCPCEGISIEEILTQKGHEEPEMLPSLSAQFEVQAASDNIGSRDGSRDLGE